ncbi:MAG: hypothetical protein KGV51_04760 [Moraxellaceae bacterium]|nr:hypothetical protein [Moraxellaceae bacterium]
MTKTQRFKLLKQLSCCQCGADKVQIAHSNFREHGKARGKKADDKYTIPLCHFCHAKFDRYEMGMTREQSKEWFSEKLRFVNATIDNKDTDREPAF